MADQSNDQNKNSQNRKRFSGRIPVPVEVQQVPEQILHPIINQKSGNLNSTCMILCRGSNPKVVTRLTRQ